MEPSVPRLDADRRSHDAGNGCADGRHESADVRHLALNPAHVGLADHLARLPVLQIDWQRRHRLGCAADHTFADGGGRQRGSRLERIPLMQMRVVGLLHPGQAFQRQAVADGTVARDKKDPLASEWPVRRLPDWPRRLMPSRKRQGVADRLAEAAGENPRKPGPFLGTVELRVERVNIHWQRLLLGDERPGVLVGLLRE